jgi:Carboxypeptidase regulatory-like domain
LLKTPLGVAQIANDDMLRIQGIDYMDVVRLGDRLACDISYLSSEVAVSVKTPWSMQAKPKPRDIIRPQAEFSAPSVSLSGFRSETNLRHDGNGNSWRNLTDLGGSLGPGFWRARFHDDFNGNQRLDTLAWILDRGRSRVLLGQHDVLLGPLLNGFSLTGAEYAYSNRPDTAFGTSLGGDQLVASRYSPQGSLRGEGPPGGIAELRIDGRAVQRQTIALDGRYEFRDVPLVSGGANRVQVVIFDRRELGTPLRVDDVVVQASDLLLPRGGVIHYAGIGRSGNAFDQSQSLVDNGGAGFYQVRYGAGDRLTLEMETQRANQINQSVAGVVAGLGPLGVWAAYAARSGDAGSAYELLGDGNYGRWFWRADLIQTSDGYSAPDAVGRSDRFAEAGVAASNNLRLSLVGRSLQDPVLGKVEYVKPAASWRPFPSLGLSARPDFDGRYAYSAQWTPRGGTRVGASRFQDRTELEVDQSLRRGLRMNVAIVDDDLLGRRESVLLSGDSYGRHSFNWSAGALASKGRYGYVLDAGLEIIPGLSAQAQLINDPLLSGVASGSGPTFFLSMVADFAVTSSGLARGAFRQDLRKLGGISGAIRGDLPADFDRKSLAGVELTVDNQVRGSVDASGRFLISELPPGVYFVGLDSEHLPIELDLADRGFWVEVASGSVTRVDFRVELRLGFAGRVFGAVDNKPQAAMKLAVVDAEGKSPHTVTSNDFGYFRIDGLPPGRYRLQALADDGTIIAELPVELRDHFVFGQDLSLPPSAKASKPQ